MDVVCHPHGKRRHRGLEEVRHEAEHIRAVLGEAAVANLRAREASWRGIFTEDPRAPVFPGLGVGEEAVARSAARVNELDVVWIAEPAWLGELDIEDDELGAAAGQAPCKSPVPGPAE